MYVVLMVVVVPAYTTQPSVPSSRKRCGPERAVTTLLVDSTHSVHCSYIPFYYKHTCCTHTNHGELYVANMVIATALTDLTLGTQDSAQSPEGGLNPRLVPQDGAGPQHQGPREDASTSLID